MAITRLEIKRCPDPNSRICRNFIGCKSILQAPKVGDSNIGLNSIIAGVGCARYFLPSTAILSVLELLIHRKIINLEFINNFLESLKKGNIVITIEPFSQVVGLTLGMMLMASIYPTFRHYNFELMVLFNKDCRDNLENKEVKRLGRMAHQRGFTNGEEFRRELDAYNLYLVKKNLIEYVINHFFQFEGNKKYQLSHPETLDIYVDGILIDENNWNDILDGLCQWNVVTFLNSECLQAEQVLSRGLINEIRLSL